MSGLQTASARLLGRKLAGQVMQEQLGLAVDQLTPVNDTRDRQAVLGEFLRATLWALSQRGSEPIYTTRLLYAALPPARALREFTVTDHQASEDQVWDALKQTLAELEAIGDVASLPRGYWLPTPLRYIPLRSGRRWLLLGGCPTRMLPPDLRRRLEWNDVARFLCGDPTEIGEELSRDTLENWTRVPAMDLVAWGAQVIRSSQLQPFEDPEIQFEYYAPEIVRQQLQFNRWTSNAGRLADGRHLARRKYRHGTTSFSIVELDSGRVIASGPPQLDDGDIRRLLYALDALAALPVIVEIEHSHEDRVFVLRNELPRAENRLFTALGQLLPSVGDQYYPRRWKIRLPYVREAIHALRALEIQIPDQTDAEKEIES